MGHLIGITQRVDEVESTRERRDSLDQAWVRFMDGCGLDFVPIPNCLQDPVRWLKKLGVTGLIFSGGNDIWLGDPSVGRNHALERDRVERLLLEASIIENWPVLGVCRGMQMLNVFHGGTLERMEGHVARTHRLEQLAGPLLETEANSFHNFGISRATLGSELEVWALSGKSVEAFGHQRLPHYGIMWHPEREPQLAPLNLQLVKDIFMKGLK